MSTLPAFTDELRQRAAAGLTPLLRWIGQQPDPVDLELACPEHPDPSRGRRAVSVVRMDVCLAALPPSAYLELVAVGVAGVSVRLDGCGTSEEAGRQVEAANRLLAACACSDRVEVTRAAPTAPPRVVHDLHSLPVGRRSLLLLAGPGGSRQTVARSGSERERALGALRSLSSGREPGRPGSPFPADDLAVLDAPSAVLSVTGCTGCGVCVRACPTGALRLHQVQSTDDVSVHHLSLRQMPADCLDCGECERLCPELAVTVVGRHSWAELLSCMPQFLMTRDMRACARCGGALVPVDVVGGLCPVCDYRRHNPFGSVLPTAAPARPSASGRRSIDPPGAATLTANVPTGT